ncbi:MAG: glycoside hydrolase family 3 C-terminal domain-containing protein, partial [Acholeplasmatales bacterium]|nr:glycoside hydrolase family 3 C-terminal domain-containing protein [Acholeplasmatales bacterium]
MEFELAQESVERVESEYNTSENMKLLCKKLVSEGCVMLENDGTLPVGNKKIALFGRCQINTFYAGYGSGGDVKSPYKISILDGLINHNANLNQKLMDKYLEWTKDNKPNEGTWGNWPLCFDEMPISDSFVKEIKKDSDIAIVIIGRSAGEDRDILRKEGSWYLNEQEKEMLRIIRANFDKLCVLINSGSIMDVSEILEYKPNALMYIWQGGQEMGNGVASVILGEISPSGKLTDTQAKIEDYPCNNNFGNPDYSIYEEDIYVGYRYFNTFKKDKIIYPFGYGLGYSKFNYKV